MPVMPNLISSARISDDYIEAQFGKSKTKLIAPSHVSPRRYENTFLGQDDLFTIIKLVDKVQLDTLSFASFEDVSFGAKDFTQVQLSRSLTRREGMMSYIFRFVLIELEKTIISGDTHTLPGSMNFWKSLRQYEEFEIKILDINTGEEEVYEEQKDIEIWGVGNEYLTGGKLNIEAVEADYSNAMLSDDLRNYLKTNGKEVTNKSNILLYVYAK